MADLNADNRRDLVVVSGTVRVLLGNGDGNFQTTAASYLAGGNSQGVAASDFDGDGTADLAVVNAGSEYVSLLLNDGYWGGPAVYFYIYPDSGTVNAGAPFDVYVIPLNAALEIVTNYTGQVWFYPTDPLAVTPVYYQFQRSDRGIAAFPGGLTFNTPGLHDLWVFDLPAVQVWGYAAFDVLGAAPGRSGRGPGDTPDTAVLAALDRDSGHELKLASSGLGYSAAVSAMVPASELLHQAAVMETGLFARLNRGRDVPRPVFDQLFARMEEEWLWE